MNGNNWREVGLSLSNVAALMSGIIQGSGIGSVMFLVYIDHLAKFLKPHVQCPSQAVW